MSSRLFAYRVFEFLRGHTRVLFIQPEKIRIVFESRGKASLGYGISAADKVIDKMNAAQDEIIVHRNTDLLAE